jgi:hypothetical protein
MWLTWLGAALLSFSTTTGFGSEPTDPRQTARLFEIFMSFYCLSGLRPVRRTAAWGPSTCREPAKWYRPFQWAAVLAENLGLLLQGKMATVPFQLHSVS